MAETIDCEQCEETYPVDSNAKGVIINGDGLFCDTDCWSGYYGQPWPHSRPGESGYE